MLLFAYSVTLAPFKKFNLQSVVILIKAMLFQNFLQLFEIVCCPKKDKNDSPFPLTYILKLKHIAIKNFLQRQVLTSLFNIWFLHLPINIFYLVFFCLTTKQVIEKNLSLSWIIYCNQQTKKSCLTASNDDAI